MWARVIEFMLACWLCIARFVFHYPQGTTFFKISDLGAGTLIAFFALVCYYKPLRKMHLCNLLIACYLISLSYFFRGSPFSVLLQNYMVLGILLLMIALIPSEASLPPMPWRWFYADR